MKKLLAIAFVGLLHSIASADLFSQTSFATRPISGTGLASTSGFAPAIVKNNPILWDLTDVSGRFAVATSVTVSGIWIGATGTNTLSVSTVDTLQFANIVPSPSFNNVVAKTVFLTNGSPFSSTFSMGGSVGYTASNLNPFIGTGLVSPAETWTQNLSLSSSFGGFSFLNITGNTSASNQVDYSATAVIPEPASLTILALALCTSVARKRRRSPTFTHRDAIR